MRIHWYIGTTRHYNVQWHTTKSTLDRQVTTGSEPSDTPVEIQVILCEKLVDRGRVYIFKKKNMIMEVGDFLRLGGNAKQVFFYLA